MSGAWQGLIPFLLVASVAVELDNVLPLEAVLQTELLDARASRPPDYELENSCLKRLLNGFWQSPGTILEQLTEVILEACSAESAGISLIHEETGDFWWPAIAGKLTHHVGSGTPRNFSPCAEVVARNRGLLFCLPERRYTYLKGAGESLQEVLLAPFHVEGNPVGTVWTVHHTPEDGFDSEDLRRLTSCAAFASSAYLIRKSMNESQKQQASLAASATRQRILSEALADLLKASSSDTALRGVFAKVSEHLRVDMYFNYMLQAGEDKLSLHSYSGITAETAQSIATLRMGEAICGKVAETKQPVIRCDIQNSTQCDAQLVRRLGVKAYACNPLMAGERLLGTLSFASTSRDSFDHDELAFIALISQYVSVAMVRVESETMLKDSDRRKDEFLAMLSHELRNPLAPIHSGIQVLKEKATIMPFVAKFLQHWSVRQRLSYA